MLTIGNHIHIYINLYYILYTDYIYLNYKLYTYKYTYTYINMYCTLNLQNVVFQAYFNKKCKKNKIPSGKKWHDLYFLMSLGIRTCWVETFRE